MATPVNPKFGTKLTVVPFVVHVPLFEFNIAVTVKVPISGSVSLFKTWITKGVIGIRLHWEEIVPKSSAAIGLLGAGIIVTMNDWKEVLPQLSVILRLITQGVLLDTLGGV